MQKKNKAVVFDFDGVIADTFEFHRKKIEEYFSIALSVDDYKLLHTGNVHNSRLGKSHDWNDYFQFIQSEYSKLDFFDEIDKIIKNFCEKLDLFIISSGHYVNIKIFLEKERMQDCFKEVLGVEFHKSKVFKFNHLFEKYNLDVDDVLFVTDTSGDVFEAKEVGVKSIAVTWGFHDRKLLAESDPEFYANEPEDILKIVKDELVGECN